MTAAIRAEAERILSGRFRRACRVARLRRRLSPYSSTFRVEELDIRLDDGRHVDLVLKDLSTDAVLDHARGVRAEFLYDPRREIQTYRQVLRPARLGTPAYYGALVDERKGRYWLFLERVRGLELRDIGELETWERAARWLGTFHRRFQHPASRAGIVNRSRLVPYDGAFFRIWIDRALQNAARRSGRTARDAVRRIERIARRYDRVVERLASLPATIIHGEFYACNVIVQPDAPIPRICPVDWELAAEGPGLIDLAALSAGAWSDEQKRRLIAAYQSALAGDDRPGLHVAKDVLESLEYCRLHLAVRMLGWSGDHTWTPPPQHAQDWLSEATHLGKRLGL